MLRLARVSKLETCKPNFDFNLKLSRAESEAQLEVEAAGRMKPPESSPSLVSKAITVVITGFTTGQMPMNSHYAGPGASRQL
jgi:hypothetical protein